MGWRKKKREEKEEEGAGGLIPHKNMFASAYASPLSCFCHNHTSIHFWTNFASDTCLLYVRHLSHKKCLLLTCNVGWSRLDIVQILNEVWTCNIFLLRMDDHFPDSGCAHSGIVCPSAHSPAPFPLCAFFLHFMFFMPRVTERSLSLSLLPPSEEEPFEDSSFLGHGFYLPLSVWRRRQGGQFGVELRAEGPNRPRGSIPTRHWQTQDTLWVWDHHCTGPPPWRRTSN